MGARGPLRGSPIVARRSAPDPLDGGGEIVGYCDQYFEEIRACGLYFGRIGIAGASLLASGEVRTLCSRSRARVGIRVHDSAVCRSLRLGARDYPPVARACSEPGCLGTRHWLSSSCRLADRLSLLRRLSVHLMGTNPALLSRPSNQSFERTRSAAASGCAGQQFWRAAQLQIRYTSG